MTIANVVQCCRMRLLRIEKTGTEPSAGQIMGYENRRACPGDLIHPTNFFCFRADSGDLSIPIKTVIIPTPNIT